MNQYNTLKVNLYNPQLTKLKSRIENDTEVTLKLSSKIVGDSNDEDIFLHILLWTNTQVLRDCRAFTNNS